MVVHFLIELRLHGDAKDYAKVLIYDIGKKFRVKGAIKERPVPHITLYGPSEADNIKGIVSEVDRIAGNYTLVPFQIKGFGYFKKEHKVIYLNINPSSQLEELRRELAQRLSKISTGQPWDRHRRFQFHVTVAFKDIDEKFNKIWRYLKTKEKPSIEQHPYRITILEPNNRKILYEYDLMLKKLLDRRQALSSYWKAKTVSKSRELQALPHQRQQSAPIRFIRFIRRLGN